MAIAQGPGRLSTWIAQGSPNSAQSRRAQAQGESSVPESQVAQDCESRKPSSCLKSSLMHGRVVGAEASARAGASDSLTCFPFIRGVSNGFEASCWFGHSFSSRRLCPKQHCNV